MITTIRPMMPMNFLPFAVPFQGRGASGRARLHSLHGRTPDIAAAPTDSGSNLKVAEWASMTAWAHRARRAYHSADADDSRRRQQ